MRAALDAQRALALKQYRADLRALGGVLTQTLGRVDVDDAINERIEAYAAQWPDVMAAVRPRRADMPYRLLPRLVEAKLAGTPAQAGHGYAGVAAFIPHLRHIATSLPHPRRHHPEHLPLPPTLR